MTDRTRTALAAGMISACLLLTGPAVAAQSESSASSDAAAYCTEQGGSVVERTAYLDTNAAPADWVELGQRIQLCEFSTGEGDTASSVSVDLVTLHSEQPTLAGLAYLAQVPSSNAGPAGANPAIPYCQTDLGGTTRFGTSSAGGGWVDPSRPDGSQILNLCVFADRSAIDDFGLFYRSAGEIRGVDLSTVMRYQSDGSVPGAFSPDP